MTSNTTSKILTDGLLLLDKPAGPTSHDVVSAVRHALGTRRVGHTGTLDPFATGLLVLLVGRATRLAQYLAGLDKAYEGVIRFGATSDTDDRTGTITPTGFACEQLSDAALAAAMADLTGSSAQRPPAFSAKRVNGERAHRLARRGEVVELASRLVRVDRFVCTERRGSDITFQAVVASGTYVRALARDLGAALGCGAYLQSLRRTSVGPFRVEDAIALAELQVGADVLLPSAAAVQHLPMVEIDDDTRRRVAHGQPVEGGDDADGVVALMADDRLIAVAERDGTTLKPRVVLSG